MSCFEESEQAATVYLSTRKAAELLDTTVRSIQGHVARGTLKPDLLDGQPFKGNRFKPETLLTWAAEFKKRKKEMRRERAAEAKRCTG